MKKLVVALSMLIASAAWAAGPTGFGSIKIGMSKEAVEGLSQSEGVRLQAPLVPFEYRREQTPVPGVDKFTGLIISPMSENPLKTEFNFRDGFLLSFNVSLEREAILTKLRKQISEKYGDPRTVDDMKEEQCVYRNGSNFKIKSGIVSNHWEEGSGSSRVETVLSTFVFDICPSSLRYGSVGGTTFHSLRIGSSAAQEKKKEENLF